MKSIIAILSLSFIVVILTLVGCATRIKSYVTLTYLVDNLHVAGMYVFRDAKIVGNRCEWGVWHDMSGLWSFTGILIIEIDGNDVVIDAPNDIVRKKAIWLCGQYPNVVNLDFIDFKQNELYIIKPAQQGEAQVPASPAR